MELAEKIGLVLLALLLVMIVAGIGPQGLGAVLGAALMLGMIRVVGPRR